MTDTFALNNRKDAIVGTGNVGASIEYVLTIRNLTRENVLINRTEALAKGESQDIHRNIHIKDMVISVLSIIGVNIIEQRPEELWID